MIELDPEPELALCADAVVALTPMAAALTANAPKPTAILPVIL